MQEIPLVLRCATGHHSLATRSAPAQMCFQAFVPFSTACHWLTKAVSPPAAFDPKVPRLVVSLCCGAALISERNHAVGGLPVDRALLTGLLGGPPGEVPLEVVAVAPPIGVGQPARGAGAGLGHGPSRPPRGRAGEGTGLRRDRRVPSRPAEGRDGALTGGGAGRSPMPHVMLFGRRSLFAEAADTQYEAATPLIDTGHERCLIRSVACY